MPTQKDVADLAGVSFITVSRVINGKENVKEDTRVKVEDAIRRLNYYPSSIGRALNNGLVHTIGVSAHLSPLTSFERNEYYHGILQGIEDGCMEYGFDMLLSTQKGSDTDTERDFDFFRPYYQKKVDGVIVFASYGVPDRLRAEVQHIPSVFIGCRAETFECNYLDVENETVGYLSAKRLIELGHRNIALLTVEDGNKNLQDRLVGIRRALSEAGAELSPGQIIHGDYTIESGRHAARDLLSISPRPTALIAATDLMAIGFMSEMAALGYSLPYDISLISFDGISIGQMANPSLYTFRQPLYQIGYEAAVSLARLLSGHPVERLCKVFAFEEVKGGSVGPCPSGL